MNYMTPDQCKLLFISSAEKSLSFYIPNIDIRSVKY